MERITVFTPAFDRRELGHGVHGVDLRMVLKGKLGAVQFVLFTNWHLKSVDTTTWDDRLEKPLPADLGYHSPKPMFDDHELCHDKCEYLDGPCYYDGSTLNAERVFNVLLEKGSDGVWKLLEEYYIETFGRLE